MAIKFSSVCEESPMKKKHLEEIPEYINYSISIFLHKQRQTILELCKT